MFLGFANFYRQFIQGFSRITAPINSILRTGKPRKGRVGVGGDSRAGRGETEVNGSGMDDIEVDDIEVEVDEVGKKDRKTFESKNLSKSKKTVVSDFLTPGVKLAFTKLRQTFLKALILYHFDLERHIRIETDALGYAIGGVLSQLILDDLGRSHPVAFFFCKMVPAKTRYKIYNGELLSIIETFKTWKNYLEGS